MIGINARRPPEAQCLTPYGLTSEYLHEPLGLDELRPRLSWKLTSPRRDDFQTAYRITVALTPADLDAGARLLWDSGWRKDEHPTAVEYDGPRLQSSTRYHWAVEVTDGEGTRAGRAASWFETGLLHGEWEGVWIGHDPLTEGPMEPPQETDRTERTRHLTPAPHLRRRFELASRPVRARAYVSARGLYELRINGRRVGDVELAPGWTDYRHRIPYQTYDITDLLTEGANAVAAVLADGWWSGYVGFDSRHAAQHYGRAPELIAQLLFDFADGSQRIVATDGSWRERDGEIRHADLLMGEYVDARCALPGWDTAEFDDRAWAPVLVADDDTTVLEAAADQPVRVVDVVDPVSIERREEGSFVVDLGQNFVGRTRLTVRDADSGRRIELRFAEMLDEEGGLYLANLRTAEATDVYRAAGAGDEVFEPRFTFHGFRYVHVRNYPGQLRADDIVGLALQSDTPWTGDFTSSDAMTNRLMSNIRWGQRGNFISIPTDCPQRDERLGWLADAQLFLPTAMRNADVAAFFARWMRDVVDAQHRDGAFPDVVPEVSMTGPGAPAWGDAGVIIPWLLYREYADRRVLERSFPAMTRWVDYVHRHNPDLIWRNRVGNHYGDWLQVGPPTPRDVLATAYFARSATLTSAAAKVLNHTREAEYYGDLATRVRRAFCDAFVTDGAVEGETQTAYLLALGFDLLPDHLRPAAGRRLATLVEENANHLTTGFVGVGLLCPVLCDIGRGDLAYALLHQDTYPSWAYSILQGATTIWERWDGWTAEGGFQSPEMNSFNHYSLGSVGDWLYGYVAGIRQADDSQAWTRALIAPVVGGQLTEASAEQHTVRGRIRSSWRLDGERFTLAVEVPPSIEAVVRVPTAEPRSVREGDKPLDQLDLHATEGSDHVEVAVAAGRYRFTAVPPTQPGSRALS